MLHLDNNNGTMLIYASVRISTIEFPSFLTEDLGYTFETCMFAGASSEILERYNSLSEAVSGHFKHCINNGVKR